MQQVCAWDYISREKNLFISKEWDVFSAQSCKVEFELSFSIGQAVVKLQERRGLVRYYNTVYSRKSSVSPEGRVVIYHSPRKNRKLRLVVSAQPGAEAEVGEMSIDIVDVSAGSNQSTIMPSWGLFKRLVHNACKKSKIVNSMVAQLHMRLGHEECLSVPLYLAVCPTGRCNANCVFCSVDGTRPYNRSHEIPLEKLYAFLEPSVRSALLLGIEGNGEPTIASTFPALLEFINTYRIPSYLITNGAALTPEKTMALAAANIVNCNFSLNAASESTYSAVMHLKSRAKTLQTIRLYSDWSAADISVSFVVNRFNAHEVLDFLLQANDLPRLDTVYIHPLSEVGTKAGAVQDLRDIVPYKHEVQDVLDAIEYFKVHFWSHNFKISEEPFNSFKLPIQQIEGPFDAPEQLLLPWPKYWETLGNALVSWQPKGIDIKALRRGHEPVELLCSCYLPVNQWEDMVFQYSAQGHGELTLRLENENGEACATINITEGDNIRHSVHTASATRLRAIFLSTADDVAWSLNIVRFRTPPPFPVQELRLPPPRRWERCASQIEVRWQGTRLTLFGYAESSHYILKSYEIPLPAGQSVHEMILDVQLNEGELCLGVLDSVKDIWQDKITVQSGQQAVRLDTKDAASIQLIFYAAKAGALDCSVDFGIWLEGPDTFTLSAIEMPSGIVSQNDSPVALSQTASNASCVRKKKQRRLYCQFPWMNMSNLTTDGRVDICCITTGDSQMEYALGNMKTDSFQSMWNGATMRRFRRTLNTDVPPAPCLRCPLNKLTPWNIFWRQACRDFYYEHVLSLRHCFSSLKQKLFK